MLDASLLLAEAHEELAPLIAPAPVIAGVFAVAFVVLGYVVFSYRDVANRSLRKANKLDHHDGPIDEFGHPENH